MNPCSEIEAQRIMEALCPNPILRAKFINIISDGIIEANRYDRRFWAISVSEKSIMLIVNHYYVCTIETNGIWLALDDAFMHNNEHNDNYLPAISQLNSWGWTMDDRATQRGKAYPTYKDRSRRLDFSVNGLYAIGENYSEGWMHIRKLFLGFIYKATFYGQKMDERSPDKHCSGFLKYIRNQYGIALPDPLYELQK